MDKESFSEKGIYSSPNLNLHLGQFDNFSEQRCCPEGEEKKGSFSKPGSGALRCEVLSLA